MARTLVFAALFFGFLGILWFGSRRGWLSFGPAPTRERSACIAVCGSRGVVKALVSVDETGAEWGYLCECGVN